MQLHNIGLLSGYNPPIPKEQSVQEFNDYQYAMKVQQEQLYKAAQGKKVKKQENNNNEQNKNINNNNDIPMDDVQKQQVILQQKHMNMNSMSSINMNNNRQIGSKSMQQMQLHNIGLLSGYNPPIPKEQSVQEFNDYQYAMKVQQEQLYKAAQGKKVKKQENNNNEQNKNINNNNDIPMDDVQKQQVILQQKHMNMNSMSSINMNNNRQIGSKSMQQMQLHNIG
eukprot:146295_1